MVLVRKINLSVQNHQINVFGQIVTDDMGSAIEQGFAEALLRDPDQQMQWVVLIDGQPQLINQVIKKAEENEVSITIVQDVIHVIEYLWKAAHALHPNDSEKREQWVAYFRAFKWKYSKCCKWFAPGC